MELMILGDGPLGRAIAAAAAERGDGVRVLGRPAGGTHDPATFAAVDAVVEASRAGAVAANVAAALEGGVRRLVLATTAWEADRAAVEHLLVGAGAAAVVAPNLSLGVALFGRLVDAAVDLYGGMPSFDPYVVEWHRRGKADRPSGTARLLATRIVAAHPRMERFAIAGDGIDGAASDPAALEVIGVRAGSNPGSHLVGFDGPGETIELRCTARDRSAYALGALAALDWLASTRRTPGSHPFDRVVDDLLRAEPAMAR